LTTYDIADAAKNGDIVANKALDIWHQHLAAGLVNIAFILNPNCFVFAGGLSSLIEMERLEELVKDRCLPEVSNGLEFLRSPLGESAGVVGAAQLTAFLTSS
jgi:predicted NBD/HSP70 family sugar kinase